MSIVAVVKQGTLMAELRQGDPRLEIRLPQSVTVFGGQGHYKVVVGEKSQVVVREGKVKVQKADKSKADLVKVDQRVVVSESGDWPKVETFTAPETVWR
jgi:hypothetical protein